MITIKDFPCDGYYWIQRTNLLPEIVRVRLSDASIPRIVFHGIDWERTLVDMASSIERVKLIDPATDPFAPEFSLTVRRAAAPLLSGRIAISHGDASALLELERQANAPGGPLRIWINDIATPDGRLCEAGGRMPNSVPTVESSPCQHCGGTGEAVKGISVGGIDMTRSELIKAAQSDRTTVVIEGVTPPADSVYIQPGDVRRTRDPIDASGDEFDQA